MADVVQVVLVVPKKLSLSDPQRLFKKMTAGRCRRSFFAPKIFGKKFGGRYRMKLETTSRNIPR
jgi:hypothetical protein